MPALRDIDGCVGLSLLVDRQSGRCIATSSWESAEAMQAADGQVQPIRDRAAAIFGGSGTVEEWDIAVLHRDHRTPDGSCVRATWVQVPPGAMDQGIDYYKATVLSDMETLEGFCSASLMVDRRSGRAVSCATFDSLAALQRGRDQATQLKMKSMAAAGVQELDECEFELALAHLRVPELV